MPLEELEASLNNIIAEMDKGYELDADIKQIIEQYDKEYAWDDVNHMELPIKYDKEARAEEMGHMKNKIFKIVKIRIVAKNGEAGTKHEMGRYG